MEKILLTNIQRFSLHDGPGIRTTVFLKGCSLRCPWCSNPENLISVPQSYMKDGVEGTYGTYYTPDEVVKECLKDREYYEGSLKRENWNIRTYSDLDHLPGGVTFSGGEALLQMEAMVPVCEKLHEADVHITAETCLFVPEECLRMALNHIDLFYVDVKILDADRCREVEKGSLELYLSNLEVQMNSGLPIIIRVPVIGGRTDDKTNRAAVKELIKKYKEHILKIELIKEHNLGESKYESLGLKMDYRGVDDALLEQYKTELEETGIPTEICRL